MGEYRLTPRAEDDLRQIWRTIAEESEAAADRLLSRLFEKFELVATQPRMGARRVELSATARILVQGMYIVIYEPTPYGIMVVAVVHGKRDPEDWLS